jgi:putative lipase involved disintegration of autophagic bodies
VAGASGWFNNSYQGELALEFYNQVTAFITTTDVLLTGHSLGGGLHH